MACLLPGTRYGVFGMPGTWQQVRSYAAPCLRYQVLPMMTGLELGVQMGIEAEWDEGCLTSKHSLLLV
jgi:hypothetical protein